MTDNISIYWGSLHSYIICTLIMKYMTCHIKKQNSLNENILIKNTMSKCDNFMTFDEEMRKMEFREYVKL